MSLSVCLPPFSVSHCLSCSSSAIFFFSFSVTSFSVAYAPPSSQNPGAVPVSPTLLKPYALGKPAQGRLQEVNGSCQGLIPKWAGDPILASEPWGDSAGVSSHLREGLVLALDWIVLRCDAWILYNLTIKTRPRMAEWENEQKTQALVTSLWGRPKPTSGLPVRRDLAWWRHREKVFSFLQLKGSCLQHFPSDVLPQPFGFLLKNHQCFHVSLSITSFSPFPSPLSPKSSCLSKQYRVGGGGGEL